MRYTANEADNLRKKLGLYYQKDEEKKIITYNPSENHFGENDYTTMDSIKNMLEIAKKEDGYAVQTTLNRATFQVNAGMSFDEGWQAFQEALQHVPPIDNTAYKQAEQERLNGITSIDTPQIMSMLSGRSIPGTEFRDDSGDIKYVLQHLKDFKYDERKDLEENIIAAFPEYKLKEISQSYSSHMDETKNLFKMLAPSEEKFRKAFNTAINHESAAEWAKAVGIPEQIPLGDRYDPSLPPQIRTNETTETSHNSTQQTISVDPEQEHRNGIKELDTAQILSMVSGVFVVGADYRDDTGDIDYVLKHLKDYKYDEKKDTRENLIKAFPQLKLKEIGEDYKSLAISTRRKYKLLGMSKETISNKMNNAFSRAPAIEWASKHGIPPQISVEERYDPSLPPQIKTAEATPLSHAEERLQDLHERKAPPSKEETMPTRTEQQPTRTDHSFVSKLKRLFTPIHQ